MHSQICQGLKPQGPLPGRSARLNRGDAPKAGGMDGLCIPPCLPGQPPPGVGKRGWKTLLVSCRSQKSFSATSRRVPGPSAPRPLLLSFGGSAPGPPRVTPSTGCHYQEAICPLQAHGGQTLSSTHPWSPFLSPFAGDVQNNPPGSAQASPKPGRPQHGTQPGPMGQLTHSPAPQSHPPVLA